jgi:hypothetical protein
MGTSVTFFDVTSKQLRRLVAAVSKMDAASRIEVCREHGPENFERLFNGTVGDCLDAVLS